MIIVGLEHLGTLLKADVGGVKNWLIGHGADKQHAARWAVEIEATLVKGHCVNVWKTPTGQLLRSM